MSKTQTDVYEDLEAKLQEWILRMKAESSEAGSVILDQATKRKLEALGYL